MFQGIEGEKKGRMVIGCASVLRLGHGNTKTLLSFFPNPPTPAEGGGAREGLQVREPCASSSQHEPAGNRRFHCSMLLEHMHHWSRNLLRFFVAARTCRQQTLPLLHAARTHASVEPQATATYEPLWRWLTMSRSCSLRPSPSRKQGWAPKV